ncbi:MAG: F-box protein [Chlamydiales bacterium]|nr:F-box protein [Chlamydiales bacterium]
MSTGLVLHETKGPAIAEPTGDSCPADTLPAELLNKIFSFLLRAETFFTEQTLQPVHFAAVCKSWRREADFVRWNRLMQRAFPSLPAGEGDIPTRCKNWQAMMARNVLAGRFTISAALPIFTQKMVMTVTENAQRHTWYLSPLDEHYERVRIRHFKTGEILREFRTEKTPANNYQLFKGKLFQTYRPGGFRALTRIQSRDLTTDSHLFRISGFSSDEFSAPPEGLLLNSESGDFNALTSLFEYIVSNDKLVIPLADRLEVRDPNTGKPLGSIPCTAWKNSWTSSFEEWVFLITSQSIHPQLDAEGFSTEVFNLRTMSRERAFKDLRFGQVVRIDRNFVVARVTEYQNEKLTESLLLFNPLKPNTPAKILPIDERDYFEQNWKKKGANLCKLGEEHLLLLGRKTLSIYNTRTGERRELLQSEECLKKENSFEFFELFDGTLRIYPFLDADTCIDLNLALFEGIRPDFTDVDSAPPFEFTERMLKAIPTPWGASSSLWRDWRDPSKARERSFTFEAHASQMMSDRITPLPLIDLRESSLSLERKHSRVAPAPLISVRPQLVQPPAAPPAAPQTPRPAAPQTPPQAAPPQRAPERSFFTQLLDAFSACFRWLWTALFGS